MTMTGKTTDEQRRAHHGMLAQIASYHHSGSYTARMDQLRDILIRAADESFGSGWSSATMLVRLYYLPPGELGPLVGSGGFAAVEYEAKRRAGKEGGRRGYAAVSQGAAGPLVLPAVRGGTGDISEYSVVTMSEGLFGEMMDQLDDWYHELDGLGLQPWDFSVIAVDRIDTDHHHGYGTAGWDRQMRALTGIDPGEWLITADERGVLIPDVELSARAGALLNGPVGLK